MSITESKGRFKVALKCEECGCIVPAMQTMCILRFAPNEHKKVCAECAERILKVK